MTMRSQPSFSAVSRIACAGLSLTVEMARQAMPADSSRRLGLGKVRARVPRGSIREHRRRHRVHERTVSRRGVIRVSVEERDARADVAREVDSRCDVAGGDFGVVDGHQQVTVHSTVSPYRRADDASPAATIAASPVVA